MERTPISAKPLGLRVMDRGLAWMRRAAGGVSAFALTSLTTTLLAIVPTQSSAAGLHPSIGSAISQSGTPFQGVVRRIMYLALLLLPASLMLPLLLWFGDASAHTAK